MLFEFNLDYCGSSSWSSSWSASATGVRVGVLLEFEFEFECDWSWRMICIGVLSLTCVSDWSSIGV